MNLSGDIIGIAIPVLILIVFVIIFRKKDTLHELELGKILIYQDKNCSIRTDYLHASIPLTRVSVYEEFIVISTFFKIVLYYNDIERITDTLFWGFRIHHRNPEVSRVIIISSLRRNDLKREIENRLAR